MDANDTASAMSVVRAAALQRSTYKELLSDLIQRNLHPQAIDGFIQMGACALAHVPSQ